MEDFTEGFVHAAIESCRTGWRVQLQHAQDLDLQPGTGCSVVEVILRDLREHKIFALSRVWLVLVLQAGQKQETIIGGSLVKRTVSLGQKEEK